MQNAEKYLNKLVRFNFNDVLNGNKFHPDDSEKIKNIKLFTQGLINCVSVDGHYITVDYLGTFMRIEADCVAVYPDSKFQMDEIVIYTSKNEKKHGIIYYIGWHNNEKKHIYHIKKTNGKMKSRRYFEEDLEKIS